MVEAEAPVLRVVLDAEDADLAELGEQLVGGERARSLPLVDERVDLLLHDLRDDATEVVVLLGQLHGGSPRCQSG